MSLAAVFEKTKPVIDAAIQRAGFTLPFHELGEEHLPRATKFPALVWIPIGGPIVPSRQNGATGAVRAGSAVELRSNQNPRHLWTRKESVKLVLSSGTGFEDTEALLGAVVAVMREHLTEWSFDANGLTWTMSWPTTTDEPTREVASGTACILLFEVEVPLVTEKKKTAQAETATITGEVLP